MIINEKQDPLGRAVCAKVWSFMQLEEGHTQVMRMANDGTEKTFEQLQQLAIAEEAFRRALAYVRKAGVALHELDNITHEL